MSSRGRTRSSGGEVDTTAGIRADERVPDDGLFVCPTCHAALSRDGRLTCGSCDLSYLANDGTACFNDRGVYHGPIPAKPEMHRVLELARRIGYRAVLDGHLRSVDPALVRYLSDAGRAEGLSLLSLDGSERILDFGCSFGVLSRRLAVCARQVVALDVTHEKVEFLGIMAAQDAMSNLVTVCNGDPLRLPFSDGYFDWVVLNAVFEYLPQATGDPDVRRGHLRILRELRRVIRPGGGIYIATKNRASYGAVAGGRLHQLLPRAIAHRFYGGAETRDPYRHVIYTLFGYRRLLCDAGFVTGDVHWGYPNLWYPQRFVSLTAGRTRMMRDVAALEGVSVAKRAIWKVLAWTGLLPLVAPNYFLVARRAV